MLDRRLEVLRKAVSVRLPRLDVAAGQLEHAEAEIASEQRVLSPNLLAGAAQAFLRDIRYI